MSQLILKKFVLALIFSVIVNQSDSGTSEVSSICRNPNGHIGRCISIFDCDTLLFIVRNRITKDYNFLRMSQCSSDDDIVGKAPYVCCTNDLSLIRRLERIVFPVDNPNTATYKEVGTISDEILPVAPRCGSLNIPQRIYGGTEADLNEFSWMVNLEYRTASGALVTVCSGSLINVRYVVTAAHCVKGKIEQKVGPITSVRLGVHNTKTAIDCNDFSGNAPVQRVGIESISVHEDYGDKYEDPNWLIRQHNDIALIRLDRTINYTNSIQPICLPTENLTKALSSGMKLTVAGWGHNGTEKHTAEKRKITIPYVDRQKCRHIYSNLIHVADEQLCAGGIFRQDSCSGDSGGPLMRLAQGNWYLEGIVSFGRGCGLEKPAIHTRVRSYLNWIQSHLKP